MKYILKDEDLHRRLDEATYGLFSDQVDEFFDNYWSGDPNESVCLAGNIEEFFGMWIWQFDFHARDFEGL